MRKVLKHLENYQTIKTEHFEIRFDPAKDGALGRYVGDYLEGIHADLTKQFGQAPQGPILIEIFNSHEMFSGRTVALPDLHTIGACTGRMFAMASPHARGAFASRSTGRACCDTNWFTSSIWTRLDFLVPHWLTEGLAVGNEGFPRPPMWDQLLRERVPSGELLNLDTIDLGFIRPRGPLEWQMAYCQSQLYVTYLKKTYGPEVVGALLTAYSDGLSTAEVIKKVCKIDQAELEKNYLAFLVEVVKGLPGKPAEKRKTLSQLKADYEKDPGRSRSGGFLGRSDCGQRSRRGPETGRNRHWRRRKRAASQGVAGLGAARAAGRQRRTGAGDPGGGARSRGAGCQGAAGAGENILRCR